MYRTDSLREFVRSFLVEKREEGVKWVSLDILEEEARKKCGGSYKDLRGSLTKMLNRHTPGGQHKGDNYNAVDTFRKTEGNGGKLYYSLLPYEESGVWKEFT